MLNLNNSKTMPFISLGDNEFSNLLRDQTYITDIEATNRRNLSQMLFFYELPFYKCSDYTIINECMTTNNKILYNFENNIFSDINNKIIESLSIDNFSCNYYNED